MRATEKERCVLRKVRKFVAKIQIISYITTLPDKLKTRIVRLNVNSEEKKDRVYVSDFHNYYIGIRIERRLTRVQKEQKQSYRFAEQRGRSIPPSPWLCVMIIALPNYRVELKGGRGGGRGGGGGAFVGRKDDRFGARNLFRARLDKFCAGQIFRPRFRGGSGGGAAVLARI